MIVVKHEERIERIVRRSSSKETMNMIIYNIIFVLDVISMLGIIVGACMLKYILILTISSILTLVLSILLILQS